MESSDKAYCVIVSDRASEMLVQHIMFAAQVNVDSTYNLQRQIIKAIKPLKSLPQRYPWFNVEMIPVNKYRKLIVDKRYLIIYQIRDEVVYVDYVLDCKQDYQWLL